MDGDHGNVKVLGQTQISRRRGKREGVKSFASGCGAHIVGSASGPAVMGHGCQELSPGFLQPPDLWLLLQPSAKAAASAVPLQGRAASFLLSAWWFGWPQLQSSGYYQ